jgi:DNA-binding response OmpR family regulator
MGTTAETNIRKIVCIEDDEDMFKLIELILKAKGFDVLGAITGQEGLTLIQSVKPDVVLLDIMMPGMNGWDVYKLMKDDEYMRTIPVIVVTAKAQAIDETLARYIAKVDDFIPKPFTPSELEDSVNKVLGVSMKPLKQ